MIYLINFKVFSFLNKLEFVNKFHYKNNHYLPYINKLVINCYLDNFNKNNNLNNYSKFLFLLELLCYSKSYAKFKIFFTKGKKVSKIFLFSSITIRKTKILNILYFFLFFIKNNLKKKMVFFFFNYHKNVFFFKFNDITSIPGFLDYINKVKLIINFYLIINNIKFNFYLKNFKKNLGF